MNAVENLVEMSDGRWVSREEKNIIMRELFDKEEAHKPIYNHSQEEEAYRRGYSQGFFAARHNPEVEVGEVMAWRGSPERTCPPGSGMAGHTY
jgi:hypothetical protein